MHQYKYNIVYINPEELSNYDKLSDKDDRLVDDFEINSSFNPALDYIELHYYSLDGRLLHTVPSYRNFQSNQDSGFNNNQTLDTLKIDVEKDTIEAGYKQGDINLVYNFLSDPFTQNFSKHNFYIEEISSDRTEIRLLTNSIAADSLVKFVSNLKVELAKPSSGDLKLNLSKNRVLLALNIDTLTYQDRQSVVIKLYNPLPLDISTKDEVSIARQVANTVAFNITSTLVIEEVKPVYLKGPNFNASENQGTTYPSEYLSISDAFNYPVTNSYYEVKSLFEEKGAELSIDYSDYNNFVNFSSAEERLKNFKYKLDLITNYQSLVNTKTIYSGSISSYSGSKEYYEGLINSVLSNFDHYDRFLYYESSSFAWPKSGDSKPYSLVTSSATGSWYAIQLSSASLFDYSNPNQLLDTVPAFLREDSRNEKYATFIHMVAQHFDNLWVYTKAVSEKYNSDNRLNVGIAKDLIEDALRNFGVKLYSSNKSTQELFRMFTGETFNTGSESYVTEIVSGSNIHVSEEDYRKQVYKRLYHNLPLLLKSKGTERGIRVLLNSFGIPSLFSETSGSRLNLFQFGGTPTSGSNFSNSGYLSSSLDKIRTDNTGSIVDNTLSKYTSIVKRVEKYSIDSNLIELGFSPTTYINNLILESGSLDQFNIDSILGDPGYQYSSSYEGLQVKALQYLSGSITDKYDLKDFTRLIKFYDNVIFKTVKDFLPGRSDIATGIVIKPHLLERSKVKQVFPSGERHNEFSQSIYTYTVSGSSGDTFGGKPQSTDEDYFWSESKWTGVFDTGSNQYLTSYKSYYMTSGGLAESNYHNHETARYDGEFSGSYLKLTNGELNDENIYKYERSSTLTFNYNFIDGNLDCNVVWGVIGTTTDCSFGLQGTVTSNCSFGLQGIINNCGFGLQGSVI